MQLEGPLTQVRGFRLVGSKFHCPPRVAIPSAVAAAGTGWVCYFHYKSVVLRARVRGHGTHFPPRIALSRRLVRRSVALMLFLVCLVGRTTPAFLQSLFNEFDRAPCARPRLLSQAREATARVTSCRRPAGILRFSRLVAQQHMRSLCAAAAEDPSHTPIARCGARLVVWGGHIWVGGGGRAYTSHLLYH